MVSTGLVWPSLGVQSPPTTPLPESKGYLASTSLGVKNSTSTPKARPIAPVRLNSSKRASFKATATEPFCLNPVACPVLASSVLSSSDVYLANSVSVRVARNCGTNPAACQVVPQVSCRRSSNTTSLMPSKVRWYATEQPIMPPPMMTTSALAGMGFMGGCTFDRSSSRNVRLAALVDLMKSDCLLMNYAFTRSRRSGRPGRLAWRSAPGASPYCWR